jgi:hypothetical protein
LTSVAQVSAGFSATATATILVLARIVPASWRKTLAGSLISTPRRAYGRDH